ncbi:hypothetical protein C7D72_29615, partial [Klebsiella pneumoniae]
QTRALARATMVTATFGFVAVSHALKKMLAKAQLDRCSDVRSCTSIDSQTRALARATMVTATFGFVAVSHALKKMLAKAQ